MPTRLNNENAAAWREASAKHGVIPAVRGVADGFRRGGFCVFNGVIEDAYVHAFTRYAGAYAGCGVPTAAC